jgi:membrane protein implicated in regulation of membrane protease activity
VRILLRSAHIFATGTLVGGYIFNQPTATLMPWLWGSVVTGILLLAADLHGNVAVLCEMRGIAVIAKVVLLLSIPVFWEARVPLLVIILLISAVSSHLPKRMRHRVLIFPKRFLVVIRRSCQRRIVAFQASVDAVPENAKQISYKTSCRGYVRWIIRSTTCAFISTGQKHFSVWS